MEELKPCNIALLEKRLKNLSDGLRGMDGDIMVNKAMLTACRDYMAELLALRRAAPENKPLTLEQLRKMKGQPVYCIGQTRFDVHFDGWKVVTKNNSMVNVIRFTDGTDFPVDVYGKRLLAYARRPEGSETNG